MTRSHDAEHDPRDTLMECRNAIEVVDHRIVALLAQRVALAMRAAEAKRAAGLPIGDAAREGEVIRLVKKAAREHALPADALAEIFRSIVEMSRRLQDEAR
jgi:chorismate mutase